MSSAIIADLFSRARASRLLGDHETAIGHVRSVLQKDPYNAEGYNNLGLLLYESGSVENAIDSYKKSISLDPDRAEVYCNCANALLSLGVLPEAGEFFAKALSLKNDLYEALFGLGTTKQAAGDLNAAKKIFVDCLRSRPGDAAAHCCLGTIMRAWNMLDLAVVCFNNAVRFMPGLTRARMGLGEALQSAGELEESEKIFAGLIASEPENHLAYSNLFLSMNYDPAYSQERIYDAHVRWGVMVEGTQPPSQCRNGPDPGRKLLVGYVSSDFCSHPAASFLGPVIRNHDRTQFTVACYSQGYTSDEKTEEFKSLADIWREISSCSDDKAKRMIEQDRIDILVDCTGHMADNRLPLFARRCAPVQISWIGYPNTTGLKSIDYRFTDSIVDPENSPEWYTEKPVRLPNGFCAWAPPGNVPPVTGLPKLRNGHVTFGSLHTLARLNEKVIALWSRVLLAVPGSRLAIFRDTLNDDVIRRLSSWFSANGVDGKRIAFKREVPRDGHLSLYREIDIALDTFPWSGHTTACEALWMGVPVITLRGNRPAGRMVAGVLTQVGLVDWIADSEERYVDKACTFSSDTDALNDLRKNLRDRVRSSKLCDSIACARDVEKAMRGMWAKWCSGQKEEEE